MKPSLQHICIYRTCLRHRLCSSPHFVSKSNHRLKKKRIFVAFNLGCTIRWNKERNKRTESQAQSTLSIPPLCSLSMSAKHTDKSVVSCHECCHTKSCFPEFLEGLIAMHIQRDVHIRFFSTRNAAPVYGVRMTAAEHTRRLIISFWGTKGSTVPVQKQ